MHVSRDALQFFLKGYIKYFADFSQIETKKKFPLTFTDKMTYRLLAATLLVYTSCVFEEVRKVGKQPKTKLRYEN